MPANSLRAKIDISQKHGYCDNVKNITVTVDDEVYRQARIRAAEQNKSVSALVKEFLLSLQGQADTHDVKVLKLFEAMDKVAGYAAESRIDRNELHARKRVR